MTNALGASTYTSYVANAAFLKEAPIHGLSQKDG